MERSIILFNGGMNTKLSPHLIGENQAIECANVDLTKGSIYPIRDFEERGTLEATGYSNILFNNELVSSNITENRSYAIFGSRLYFTNGSYGSYGLYRWNGTTVVDAVQPTVTSYKVISSTLSSNGNLNGEYNYVYTVVDEEGIESSPSLPYAVTAENQDINLSLTGTETISEVVSFRRIYRTGGNNPTFNLIAELPVATTTYTDSTRDLDVSRIELNTYSSDTPPSDLVNLVQANGTLWASIGNRIYFSANGIPESWNSLDFLVLDDICTGLGVFTNQLVAFTQSGCYVITGTNRDNVYINKLPYQEGCLNHNTITNVTELLVWTSNNGVCAYNGSSVTLITKDILEWSKDTRVGSLTFDSIESTFDANVGYQVVKAVGLNSKYYAVYQNGIGVIDISNGIVASLISRDTIRDIFYDYQENTIGIVDEDLVVSVMDASEDNMTGYWKTGLIHQGDYSLIKDYRKIEFDIAPTEVKVYIDTKLISTTRNLRQFHLPANSIGRAIQLEIYTNKEIRSLYIQYGLVG